MSEERMEQAIDKALQRQPMLNVPEGFAVRVRGQLPPAPSRTGQGIGAGRLAGLAGMLALVAAFCWLAPGARPDFASLRFDLELVVLAEMAAVGWWVGRGVGSRG
jgi:hypothetical protein